MPSCLGASRAALPQVRRVAVTTPPPIAALLEESKRAVQRLTDMGHDFRADKLRTAAATVEREMAERRQRDLGWDALWPAVHGYVTACGGDIAGAHTDEARFYAKRIAEVVWQAVDVALKPLRDCGVTGAWLLEMAGNLEAQHAKTPLPFEETNLRALAAALDKALSPPPKG